MFNELPEDERKQMRMKKTLKDWYAKRETGVLDADLNILYIILQLKLVKITWR